jgi:HD-GYP domain-containing protein (c-di-GMP phosphodiesterase class II)
MTDLERLDARVLTIALVLCTPLGLFALLVMGGGRLDRTLAVPVPHFWTVSAVSLAAVLLAGVVSVASVRCREPRTMFVAIGFLAIAGFFSVHGLVTPDPTLLVDELHHTIVISARLSLFFGSICFLMASFDLPNRLRHGIRKRHSSILAAAWVLMLGFIAANLVEPSLLDPLPTGAASNRPAAAASNDAGGYGRSYGGYGSYGSSAEPAKSADSGPETSAAGPTGADRAGKLFAYVMAAFAAAAFLVAGYRFARAYPYTRSTLAAATAAAMLLLAQAQIVMALGTTWQTSWWLYHLLMLVGFALPMAALALAVRRGGNLGDIVEGLFLRDLFGKLEVAFPEAIDELVAWIERKDPYLRGHMRRVCQLSHDIALELGISERSTRAASFGGLLHDIGKFGIPDAVLNKPGKLTDEEFAVMQEHPDRGHRLVAHQPRLQEAAPAVRWHHERLDGSGYPDRLAGTAIPIEARIVAVADMWDAMTSDRSYRGAMSPARAYEIIARESGTKLDQGCVDALFAVLARRGRSVAPAPEAPRVETAAFQPALAG